MQSMSRSDKRTHLTSPVLCKVRNILLDTREVENVRARKYAELVVENSLETNIAFVAKKTTPKNSKISGHMESIEIIC